MGENQVILTAEGLKKLEEELDFLKGTKRGQVAERIKQAIDYGDISENSEYDDAKNEQAFVEGRIATLEKMIRNAKLIDAAGIDTEEVSVGCKVVLRDLEDDAQVEYTIVGSAEADPMQRKISNVSPVGKAILGQKKGNTVQVQVPAGVIEYEIVDIQK